MRKWIAAGSLIALLVILAVVIFGRRTQEAVRAPSAPSGPRELVAGEHGIQQPRATPADEKVEQAALEAAANYAAAHDSTALIVSRHGHIIFERYWGGSSRDTLIDAGGFARTVAALLVGIAMDDRHVVSAEEPVAGFLEDFAQGARARLSIRELLQGDDMDALVRLTEKLSGQPYAQFLSRELWKPLSAGDAWVVLDKPGGRARADCCFQARQADWMRIAALLLNDGEYQGERLVRQGWTLRMRTPTLHDPARGSQLTLGIPRDGFRLVGPGRNSLWLQPALHLAVLRLGTEPADWDDARIPEEIIRGVIDRPGQPASEQVDLSKLVPNH